MTNKVERLDHERTYSTSQGLRAGLKAAGLRAYAYSYVDLEPDHGDGVHRFAANVYVSDADDKATVERKGFTAVIDTTLAHVQADK